MQVPGTKELRSANRQVDIRQRFMLLQKKMIGELEMHDDEDHPELKGSAYEQHWLEWFRNYLPSRYCVDKARVIDCEGYVSEQLDIVVYDRQYSPFIFKEVNRTYVPAESVYAVLEVKPAINKKYVEYAGKKAASVRRLMRTSAPIPHAGGEYPPKPHGRILAGLVALKSDWTPALGEPLEGVLQEQDEFHQIDIGCALRSGSFRAVYEDGFAMSKSTPEEAFVFFYLKLLIALQRMATVPAMDIQAYGSALESF